MKHKIGSYESNLFKEIINNRNCKRSSLNGKLFKYLRRVNLDTYEVAVGLVSSLPGVQISTRFIQSHYTVFRINFSVTAHLLNPALVRNLFNRHRLVLVSEETDKTFEGIQGFIFIRNKDKFEMHLIDQNKNWVAVFQYETDKDSTVKNKNYYSEFYKIKFTSGTLSV